MTDFIEIPGPFRKLHTLKMVESETFRPASTDEDISMAYLKATMEKIEVRASHNVLPGFISSAAHHTERAAIDAARHEAIERLSVAAWWALDRPFTERLDIRDTAKLVENFEPTVPELVGTVGFVPSVDSVGHVAVAILQSQSTYPFAVLGSAFHASPTHAAKAALTESAQSWSASEWLHNHRSQSTILWDLAELKRRANDVRLAPHQPQTELENILSISTVSTPYEGAYVAWLYNEAEPVTGTTASLARLATRPSEKISVFTPHNF